MTWLAIFVVKYQKSSLYIIFYFNLIDYLITWLLYSPLIIIFKFIKLFFKNMRFTLVKCVFAPRLQRPLHLSVPHTFTDTGYFQCRHSRFKFPISSPKYWIIKKRKKKEILVLCKLSFFAWRILRLKILTKRFLLLSIEGPDASPSTSITFGVLLCGLSYCTILLIGGSYSLRLLSLHSGPPSLFLLTNYYHFQIFLLDNLCHTTCSQFSGSKRECWCHNLGW